MNTRHCGKRIVGRAASPLAVPRWKTRMSVYVHGIVKSASLVVVRRRGGDTVVDSDVGV